MAKYNTHSMKEIEDFLSSHKGEHFTINQIYNYFSSHGKPIGKTTIYRKIEELVAGGIVKKHIIDDNSSAFFEYIGNSDEDDVRYHLKCNKCGKIIHFNCSEASSLWNHLSEEHNFQIDIRRVILYGICDECRA